ncbi:MAG: EamA family transporter [Pirellulaceae bacterium]|nr:EamA family transporter [Pirellulaceae bacterium]
MNQEPKFTDWLILLLLGLMWGSGFFFIKKSVTTFDPVQMTFLRMSISTLLYLPMFALLFKKIDWSKWKWLIMVAICGYGIPNFFFALAEQNDRVSSGVAGVLNSLVPLLALTIGAIFFGASATRTKVLGIVVGLAGAIWLVAFSGGTSTAQPAYAILCVLAATMYAVNANIIGKHLRHFHPVAVGAAAFFLSSPIYFFGVWQSGALNVMWEPSHRGSLGAIVYLAVVSTVVANVLYTWLVQRTNPVFATSVAYLFPIVSLALGTLDGEQLGFIQLIGAGLILIGLYLARK